MQERPVRRPVRRPWLAARRFVRELVSPAAILERKIRHRHAQVAGVRRRRR